MLQQKSAKLSKYTCWLASLVMIYSSFFFFPRWNKDASEAAISWDVSGYYWYLPSAFIYKDLKKQSFKDSILKKYLPTSDPGDFQQAVQLADGNYAMKYSSGMAVMYLPFFAIAHIAAKPLGYPADGFSQPYQFSIEAGGLLVSLLGLWYLRKLLLYFHSDTVAAIVIGLIVVGTNYLDYSTIDSGMSHTWLFTIYVFLLLNTKYFYDTLRWKYAIRVGLLIGLATLTRPTDLLSALIPLLWGMEHISLAAIRAQMMKLLSLWKQIITAMICAGFVISIQLIYWKYASGHWLVYSYQDQHLYFRSPNFGNFTFSYRSGWLTYTPMMVFAFIGLVPFLLKGRNKVAITTFFLLNYYIVCAWSIWWYGGRAMIQSYPVLLFPFGSFVELLTRRKILLWLCTPVLLAFIYYNTWITYQYHQGKLYDTETMTKAYFWRIAGKWRVPERVTFLKDNPDLFEGTPKDLKTVYENRKLDTTGTAPDSMIVLTKAHQLSRTYSFAFADRSAQWLRFHAVFHCGSKEWETWKMGQFITRLTKGKEIVKENVIRVQRLMTDNDTKELSIDMKLPNTAYDSVYILFWSGSSDYPLWVSHIRVESFRQ